MPNIVVGPALFYGGLAQLLAGSEFFSNFLESFFRLASSTDRLVAVQCGSSLSETPLVLLDSHLTELSGSPTREFEAL